MTDQNVTNPDETADQPNPQPETVTPPEDTTAVEKKFSQAELDAILKERLTREKEKREKAEEQARKKAEEAALEEQAKFKELADQRLRELEETNARLKAMELRDLKRQAAAKHSLPEAFIERLQGDTLEELEADAKQLAEAMPKPTKPTISPTNPSGATVGETRQEALNRILGNKFDFYDPKQAMAQGGGVHNIKAGEEGGVIEK